MTPEEYILSLLGCLKQGKEEKASPCKFPTSAGEWSEWLDCAIGQGVAPLLYYRLKRTETEQAIPGQILLQLQEVYYQNAARNLRLLHELKIILGELNADQIPVVVLKGAFLAASVYRNPALRVMGDLDILAPIAEFQKALEKLYTLGYRRIIPAWQEATYHIVLRAPGYLANLEVHSGFKKITGYHNMPIDELWARAVQQDINGMKAYTFEPEDLLIYLCHHAAIHHLYKMGMQILCDADEIIRKHKNDLDWQKLSARATEWQAHRAVSLTLYLCRQYLNTPIPEAALEQLQLRNIDPEIVRETILQISSIHQNTDTLLTTNLIEMLNEKKPTGMLRIFISNLLRPNVSLPVKERDSGYRHFVSFRRLVYFRKYIGTIWQFVRKNPNITLQYKRWEKLQKWLRA